jgi:flagellar biosynthesis/type III secretory pathway protein FliH
MTKNEERCQRLMINRAYENGMKAGYEKGFKDGMDKTVDIFAKRLAETDEEFEGLDKSGGDE